MADNVMNIQTPEKYKQILNKLLKKNNLTQLYKEIMDFKKKKSKGDYIIKDSDRDKIIKMIDPYLQLDSKLVILDLKPQYELANLLDELFVLTNFLNLFAPPELVNRLMNISYKIIMTMNKKRMDYNHNVYMKKMNKFYKINEDRFSFIPNNTSVILPPTK